MWLNSLWYDYNVACCCSFLLYSLQGISSAKTQYHLQSMTSTGSIWTQNCLPNNIERGFQNAFFDRILTWKESIFIHSIGRFLLSDYLFSLQIWYHRHIKINYGVEKTCFSYTMTRFDDSNPNLKLSHMCVRYNIMDHGCRLLKFFHSIRNLMFRHARFSQHVIIYNFNQSTFCMAVRHSVVWSSKLPS